MIKYKKIGYAVFLYVNSIDRIEWGGTIFYNHNEEICYE